MFKPSQLLIGNQIETRHERKTMTVLFEGTTQDLATLLELNPERFEVLRDQLTLGDLVGLEVQEHQGAEVA